MESRDDHATNITVVTTHLAWPETLADNRCVNSEERLNLFVPQWQDSGGTDEIFHGSHALNAHLASTLDFHNIRVDPKGELKTEHQIFGYRSILGQLRRLETAIRTTAPRRVLTIGGGCGVDVPIVAHLFHRHRDLQIFWFDAHGDINSPASSPSKYFHGMALRFLLEHFEDNEISDIVSDTVPHQNIVLMGARDIDPPEAEYIARKHVRLVPPHLLNEHQLKKERVLGQLDFQYAFIHIDLDVIDPNEYRNVKCPAKEGVGISRVADAMGLIKSCREIVGISVLENTETNPREVAKLKPILQHAIDL